MLAGLAGWFQLYVLVHVFKRVKVEKERVEVSDIDNYSRIIVFPGIFTSNSGHSMILPS